MAFKWLQKFLPGGGAQLALKAGDPAPAWQAMDHTGQSHSSDSLAGQRYLIWFYPAADTPG